MRWYTVIGIYEDNNQRYATQVKASDPEDAEDVVRADIPDMLIAAVLKGRVSTVDDKTYAHE